MRLLHTCSLLEQVTPDDASLLCALGDITLDDTHYERAWEVSSQRSTRAQRALARSAQTQQKWAQVSHYTRANFTGAV